MTDRYEVRLGDCRERMAEMPDASVDSIVTDPPYGLSFMGKGWDHGVPGVEFWTEALRVAKPGAHLLAFGGTRTFHRLAVAIEDAGWEIRDCVMWVYGSGFPKSHDVSKAMDKDMGHWRGKAMETISQNGAMSGPNYARTPKGDPITDAAKQWQGWGTALKPAWEPVIVARKPLADTVAANVLEHGTGAINVDGCRVEGAVPKTTQGQAASAGTIYGIFQHELRDFEPNPAGRWPANLIHDGSDEVADPLGDAARFFYCAKASKADRDEGLDALPVRRAGALNMRTDGHAHANNQQTQPRRNVHPTVKPTDLMRYLCRLVTPPDGLVLDPFCGSGSTGKGALLEGFRFIGIEREEEYAEIARARIAAAVPQQIALAL